VDLRPTQNLLVKIAIGLESTTGLVSARFDSIDPMTGLPPTDPLVGFLPPNVNPPEGQGSVLFTVAPKLELGTGTELRNQASIVFDLNAPILTPEWVNTIDKDRPSSGVLPLSQNQSTPNFTVSWTGTDVGAGVESFTVYVSDNGGPFAAFLTNTAATSVTFSGERGHTYAFYVIARDHVGNVEGSKDVAEAVTTVLQDTTPPVITLSTITSTLWPPNGKLLPVRISGKITADHLSDVDQGTGTFQVVDEYGLVQPGGSIAIMPDGTFAFTVMLRASRLGEDRDGRHYQIVARVADRSGNIGLASASVVVPHDQGKK
jgi:hypothetical protein